MENELDYYGKFVLYNGMKQSCEFSKKSGEFLLQSLYSLVPKELASSFFLKGLKDYALEMTENQMSEKLNLSLDIIRQAKLSHDRVISHENASFFQTAAKLKRQNTKLNHIDRYKALELSKSLIFKHLKFRTDHFLP